MTLTDLRAMAQRMRNLRGRVEVGVPDGPRERGGTSVALVARVHEFGAPAAGIPQRSFLRAGIEKHLPDFQALNAANLTAVAMGTMDFETALGRLGAAAASAVQTEIVTGDFQPLKPATIKRKKSSKPLIDSGNLRQSVTFQVFKAGG